MPKPTKEEIALQRKHDALMKLVEAPYMRAIVRAKDAYIKAVAAQYEIDGTLPERLIYAHREDMFNIGKRYNTRIIKIFVKDINNQLKDFIKITEQKNERFEKWLKTILDYWIANETANAAFETAETTTDDIKKAIAVSLADNEISSQTAAKILKARGLSSFRARVIALTETHNAAMFAGKESAKRLSAETETVLLKKWIPTQDSRTRDSHAGMVNHELITMDVLFNVGGVKMDRPGDPKGGAKNVINCRCTLSYKVEE